MNLRAKAHSAASKALKGSVIASASRRIDVEIAMRVDLEGMRGMIARQPQPGYDHFGRRRRRDLALARGRVYCSMRSFTQLYSAWPACRRCRQEALSANMRRRRREKA
jgi:hypothetical protein